MTHVTRHFAVLAVLASFTATPAFAQAPAAPAAEQKPLITRIKMATIGAPDVEKVEAWYTQWLGYKVREKGKVAVAMAESWGTPNSAGKPFVLMSSEGSPDVLIRAVQIDPVPGYKAMTTFGWNSFEIIVDDLDKVHETMKASPFKIIGTPHSLGGGFASIHAMQVIGPAEEVLYLTSETGDREKSNLPKPKSQIDRPFIFILAGPKLETMRDFYVDVFKMKPFPSFDGPLTLAADAMGLPKDQIFPLTLVRAGEKGNTIEIDGYPSKATERPRASGQLPPGNAFATFNVNSLDGLKVKFITSPRNTYGPRRAAAFIGPAGEITELIEQPRD